MPRASRSSNAARKNSSEKGGGSPYRKRSSKRNPPSSPPASLEPVPIAEDHDESIPVGTKQSSPGSNGNKQPPDMVGGSSPDVEATPAEVLNHQTGPGVGDAQSENETMTDGPEEAGNGFELQFRARTPVATCGRYSASGHSSADGGGESAVDGACSSGEQPATASQADGCDDPETAPNDKTDYASRSAAAEPPVKLPHLSPDVHAAGCRMGELLLSPTELAAINQIINRSNFRFVAEPFFPSTSQSPATSWSAHIPPAPKPPAPTKQALSEPSRPRTRASTRKSTVDKLKLEQSASAKVGSSKDLVLAESVDSLAAASPAGRISAGGSRWGKKGGKEAEKPKEEAAESRSAVGSAKKRPSTRGGPVTSSIETPPRKKRALSSQTTAGAVGASEGGGPRAGRKIRAEAAAESPGSPRRSRSPIVELSAAPPLQLPPTITEPLVVEAPKIPPVIESATATWQDAAFDVLRKLEAHPMAKCFLQPIDPAGEGMQDYFQKIKTPIDLSTIKAKLTSDDYSHPFRFQTDVRQIFFNAFTYHAIGTNIWRCASELAVHFENLCKETIGVNPYAIFKRPPPSKVQAAAEAAPTGVSAAVGGVCAPVSLPTSGGLLLPAAVEATPGGTITMDAAQLKALLEQAAASGVVTDFDQSTLKSPLATTPALTPTPAGPGGAKASSAVGRRPAGAGGRRGRGNGLLPAQLPSGVAMKDGVGLVYTTDCYGTTLAELYEKSPPVSALPPPPSPTVQSDTRGLATPLAPLTQSQKKAALTRFKELDVTYRKALLDMMRDELGVHSLLCALDVRYLPDVDVLPVFRQRQFFIYLKTLVALQKEAQDKHLLPATLPRQLDWTIALSQPSAGQQQLAAASGAPGQLLPPSPAGSEQPTAASVALSPAVLGPRTGESIAGTGGPIQITEAFRPSTVGSLGAATATAAAGAQPPTSAFTGTAPLIAALGISGMPVIESAAAVGLPSVTAQGLKPSSPAGFPWASAVASHKTSAAERDLSDEEYGEDGLGFPRSGLAGRGAAAGGAAISESASSSSSSSDEEQPPKGPCGTSARGGSRVGGTLGPAPGFLGAGRGALPGAHIGALGHRGSVNSSGNNSVAGSTLPSGLSPVPGVTPVVPSAGSLGPAAAAAGFGGFGIYRTSPTVQLPVAHHPLGGMGLAGGPAPGMIGSSPGMMFGAGRHQPTAGAMAGYRNQQGAATTPAAWATPAAGLPRGGMTGLPHSHPVGGMPYGGPPSLFGVGPAGTAGLIGGGKQRPVSLGGGAAPMASTAPMMTLGQTGGPGGITAPGTGTRRGGLGLWSGATAGADAGLGGLAGGVGTPGRQVWGTGGMGPGGGAASSRGSLVSGGPASISCWPEWKGKVIQESVVTQSRVREGVDPATERERRAERADAPI